jgi:hypothetical protein
MCSKERSEYNEERRVGPGLWLLSRGAFPRGAGAAMGSVDRFQAR